MFHKRYMFALLVMLSSSTFILGMKKQKYTIDLAKRDIGKEFNYRVLSPDGKNFAVASFYALKEDDFTELLCDRLDWVNRNFFHYKQIIRMLIPYKIGGLFPDSWAIEVENRLLDTIEQECCKFEVRVYDVESEKQKFCVENAFLFTYSPNGKLIGMSTGCDPEPGNRNSFAFRVFDVKTGKEKLCVNSGSIIPYLLYEFSPNSKYIAVYELKEGESYGVFDITIFDLSSSREAKEVFKITKCVDCGFSLDSNALIYRKKIGQFPEQGEDQEEAPDGNREIVLQIYDLENKEEVDFLEQGVKSANYEISPDSKFVAVLYSEKNAQGMLGGESNEEVGLFKLIDLDTKEVLLEAKNIRGYEFSSLSKGSGQVRYFAMSTNDGDWSLYEIGTEGLILLLVKKKMGPYWFSPDGSCLLYKNKDEVNGIHLYGIESDGEETEEETDTDDEDTIQQEGVGQVTIEMQDREERFNQEEGIIFEEEGGDQREGITQDQDGDAAQNQVEAITWEELIGLNGDEGVAAALRNLLQNRLQHIRSKTTEKKEERYLMALNLKNLCERKIVKKNDIEKFGHWDFSRNSNYVCRLNSRQKKLKLFNLEKILGRNQNIENEEKVEKKVEESEDLPQAELKEEEYVKESKGIWEFNKVEYPVFDFKNKLRFIMADEKNPYKVTIKSFSFPRDLDILDYKERTLNVRDAVLNGKPSDYVWEKPFLIKMKQDKSKDILLSKVFLSR